jgi:hypothetical protein
MISKNFGLFFSFIFIVMVFLVFSGCIYMEQYTAGIDPINKNSNPQNNSGSSSDQEQKPDPSWSPDSDLPPPLPG